MTGADRMQKLLARAEAEVATLKDEVARLRAVLVAWQEWEAMIGEARIMCFSPDKAYNFLIETRKKRDEALKR